MRIVAFFLIFALQVASAVEIKNAICEQTGENSYSISFEGASPANEVMIFASPRPDQILSNTPLIKVLQSPVEVTVSGSGRVYFHLKPKNGKVRVVSIRRLPLEASYNFRDLGGYPTADGRYVKWGLLYRSGRLDALTTKDQKYLESIGLRLICDFRNTEEREKAETKWVGENAPEILNNTLYDTREPESTTEDGKGSNGSASAGGLARNGPEAQSGQPPNGPPPQNAQWPGGLQTGQAQGGSGLQNGQPPNGPPPQNIEEVQAQPYEWVFGEAREPLSVAMRRIVAGDLPMLFHCNAGKDRTGMMAALVLSLLGVPREIILQDYLLTNSSAERLTSFAEFSPDFPNMKFIASDARRILGVDVRALKATLEQIDEEYGSVDEYVIKELKLTTSEILKIRTRLLER